ncbi:hypothetical protein PSU4_44140 [Pseudonocardia sulfidoxydans NBRC 16205]|uniref:Polysaccharide biosynthesis protein C-terminal domain-containing protein n=1 Tax=Pseudonocardia sulfidoxydans NBRC 16205 TaxID=1223511 RepID=A0A511DKV9_9PSEU|nr:lipopolysaccharide biosynthesis protein [Pseudonocardia sulfidoxydans]GEL25460.1 hypothetical protein PSU4_44140 [Pseudonocardia sulfidoxydans NBRC 16205]
MALGKHRASVATTREATSDPDISTLGSTLKRGAMLSALALGLVQVVSFVQTLILARILDPEQIGLYAAGTVLMGFLLGFSEGGLRGALIQREGDVEDAADTVFWVTFVSGLGLALLSLATAPIVGMVFKSEVAGTIAAVSSGAVVLHALTNVPDGLMQRRFNFKRRLIVDPTRVLGYAVVTIALAALGFGVWSMVIGNYVGIAIWLFLSWRYARWRPGVGKFSFPLWRQMAAYAAPLLVEGIVDRVRTAAETALIGRRLDANTLGQYRYGMSLAQLPSLVIVQIGSYVLFPAFSRLQSDPPRFARAVERALQVTWVGAAPFAGLMIAVGEPAVVVLLGEKWREAGVALMVMSGYGVGIALQAVGSEVVKAVGASKMLNWTTATSLVLGIGSLVALLPLGLIGVGIAMSITEIVVGIVVLILSRRVVKFSVGRLAWMLVPPAIAAAIAMAAVWWLDRNVFGADEHGVILGILLLILETIIFALIYLAVLTVIAPKLGRSLIGAVMNKVRRGGGDDEDDEDGDEDDNAGVGSGPRPTGPDRELVGAAPGASEMTIQLPPMTASGMIGLARQVISEGLDDATVQMRLIQPMPTVRSRNRSDRKLPLAPLPQRTSADDGRNATDETIVMKAVTPDGPSPAAAGPAPAGPVDAEKTVTTQAAGSSGSDLFAAPDDSSRDATVTSDGRRWSGQLESLRPTSGSDPAKGAAGKPDADEPDAAKFAAGKPDAAKSGAGKSGAGVPDAGKPGPAAPATSGPAARGDATSGAAKPGPAADPEATRAQAPVSPKQGADAEATTVTPSVTPPPPSGAAAPRRPSPRPRPTPRDDKAQPPGDSSATAKVPAAPGKPVQPPKATERPTEQKSAQPGKAPGPAPGTPAQAPADRPAPSPASGPADEETRKLAARPPQGPTKQGPAKQAPAKQTPTKQAPTKQAPTQNGPAPHRPGSNGVPSRTAGPGGTQVPPTGPKTAQPKPAGPSGTPQTPGRPNGTTPGGSPNGGGPSKGSPNSAPPRSSSPNGAPPRSSSPNGVPPTSGGLNGVPPTSGHPNGAPPTGTGSNGAQPRTPVQKGALPGTNGSRPNAANGNGRTDGTSRDGGTPRGSSAARDGGADENGSAPRRPSPRPRPRPTPPDGNPQK